MRALKSLLFHHGGFVIPIGDPSSRGLVHSSPTRHCCRRGPHPWAATGLPRNLVSKKTYRGVNSFLLAATKYVSPYRLTLKQANQLSGSVRKGEHGELVIFWKVDDVDEADNDTAISTSQFDQVFIHGEPSRSNE